MQKARFYSDDQIIKRNKFTATIALNNILAYKLLLVDMEKNKVSINIQQVDFIIDSGLATIARLISVDELRNAEIVKHLKWWIENMVRIYKTNSKEDLLGLDGSDIITTENFVEYIFNAFNIN